MGNHTFAYLRAIRRPSVTSVMSLFFPPSTATTSYAVRKVSPMSVRKQTSTARSKMYHAHSFIASKPTLALNAMRSGTNTCRTREAGEWVWCEAAARRGRGRGCRARSSR